MKPWTAEDSRNTLEKDAKRSAQAEKKFKKRSNEWFAECQILRLQDYVEEIPPCYDNIESAMHDFWPDFSWKREETVAQIKLVLKDSRFSKIDEDIQKKYGFDLKKDLLEGFFELTNS